MIQPINDEKKNPIELKMCKDTFQTYYCLQYNGRHPELTISIIKRLTRDKIDNISIEYSDNNKLVIRFIEDKESIILKRNRVLLYNTKTHSLDVTHQNDYIHDYITPIHNWEILDTEGYTYEYPPRDYLKALKKLVNNPEYTLKAVAYTDEELEHVLDPPEEIGDDMDDY